MENLLEQSFSIQQLLPYVMNPYGFWVAFVAILFLARKPITQIGFVEKQTYNQHPWGKGVAWTYLANIFVSWGILKLISYFDGPDFLDPNDKRDLATACAFLGISLIVSPIAVWIGGIALLIMSAIAFCIEFDLFNRIGEFIKWTL